MSLRSLLGCILTGLVLVTTPLHAAPASVVGATPVTEVEGIEEYRLANGLSVLLAPEQSRTTITVNVTYRVGSRFENYGETGMAHLLEHLMFKGTPTLRDGALIAEMGRRGMRFNGSTTFDRTNYYETFPASGDNLDWALTMEADRMVHSFIARKDLDSEMTVVRNEMEMGENSPGRILWQEMAAAAYQWHSYGKDTIGARSDVEMVDISHLQAFYRNYYQPDNAVLVVSGRFDRDAALRRIVASFGALARPTRQLAPQWTVEPPQDGPRAVTLQRVGDTQMVGALYHVPSGAHPDFAAIEVLAAILGDTPNGRLYKALVASGKATSVSADAEALHDPGYLMSMVELDARQSRAEARRLLEDTLETLGAHPVTEEEVRRARTQLQNDFETEFNDPAHLGVALSGAIALGDWRLLFLDRDRVAKVSVADVQRVATTYLKASNRTSGEFVPGAPGAAVDRASIPPTPPLADMLKDYRGQAAQAQGEAFDASPQNIERRTVRGKLADGMQFALLPRQTRGNTISGALMLRMGDEHSLSGKDHIAALTAAMLERGAGNLSRAQIADRLDALQSSVAISGSAATLHVSFTTRREHLAELMDLLRDLLRAPTFPAAEFEALKAEAIAGAEAGRNQPEALAGEAMARYDNPYPKGDPRYAETIDESIAGIKAVTLADMKDFQARFYGASHGNFAVVGAFDAAALQQQLATLFDDWTSAVPYAWITTPYRASPGTSIRLIAPDKANAVYDAAIAIPMRDDDAGFAALMVGTRILGGGTLKSRLADRLRQHDGLSYGVGAYLDANAREANSSLMLYAQYAPANLDRLKLGVNEEVARLLRDGVTAAEVADAQSGLLQDAGVARTRDGTLAAMLLGQLDLGRDMTFVIERESAVRAVTVEQVNSALRKAIDPGRLVQVYAGDFANGTGTASGKDTAP